MTLGEKLAYLINRTERSKKDIADDIGITYRALAYYIQGERSPKPDTMQNIASYFNVSVDFLIDDRLTVELTSEERFGNRLASGEIKEKVKGYLLRTAEIFNSTILTADEKRTLFTCISETYFSTTSSGK